MIRLAIAGLMLCVMAVGTHAADKYAVPPHPALGTKKCAVAFGTASPSATKNAGGNWNVSGVGKYNYDTAWTFKSLTCEIIYTKGAKSKFGPSTTITDESTIGTPDSFSFSFNDVVPPVENEKMVMKVSIVVSKAGSVDETDSHAADVSIP